MKTFYSHLIEIESVNVELYKLDLSKEQALHLAGLIDSSLHHTILDTILSKLSSSDKRVFLNHLKEDEIKKAAKDLKDQLQKDLMEAKRK